MFGSTDGTIIRCFSTACFAFDATCSIGHAAAPGHAQFRTVTNDNNQQTFINYGIPRRP